MHALCQKNPKSMNRRNQACHGYSIADAMVNVRYLCQIYTARPIHRCIHCSRNRLGFYADTLTIFGTVWYTEYKSFCTVWCMERIEWPILTISQSFTSDTGPKKSSADIVCWTHEHRYSPFLRRCRLCENYGFWRHKLHAVPGFTW